MIKYFVRYEIKTSSDENEYSAIIKSDSEFEHIDEVIRKVKNRYIDLKENQIFILALSKL